MAQYNTGSVNVTNGNAVVVGVSTSWLAEVNVGDIFSIVGSGVWYTVGSVDTDLQITLNSNYAGATQSGQLYVITRDFTPSLGLPYPTTGDLETAAILKRALMLLDGGITTQSLTHRGLWLVVTTYAIDDAVHSAGRYFVSIANGNLNNVPPATGTGDAFWSLVSDRGLPGAGGGGDMYASTYDPTSVVGDAFAMDNMAEGAATKIMTGTERSKLAGISPSATVDQTGAQIRALLIAEADTNILTTALLNKLNAIEASADVTDAVNVNAAGAVMNNDTDTTPMLFVVDDDTMSGDLDTKVPTQQSVKAYVDTQILAMAAYQTAYNAATNAPDLEAPAAGAVYKGYMYEVSNAGTFFTTAVKVGDMLVATVNNPSAIGHWAIVNGRLDGSIIKTLYEAEADTNAFTTTLKDKLDGITANANNYAHPGTHSADIIITGSVNAILPVAEATRLSNVTAGTATPLMAGVGAAGAGTAYARQTHVHPSDTNRVSTGHLSVDAAAGAYVGSPAGTPVSIYWTPTEFDNSTFDIEITSDTVNGFANNILIIVPNLDPKPFIIDNHNLSSSDFTLNVQVDNGGNTPVLVPSGTRALLYSNGNHCEALTVASLGHLFIDVTAGDYVGAPAGTAVEVLLTAEEFNNTSFDLEISQNLGVGLFNDVTIAIPNNQPRMFVVDNENLPGNGYNVWVRNNHDGQITGILVPNGSRYILYSNGTHVENITSAYENQAVTFTTVNGRDIAVDGAKLDLIEANADVTDATNVANAGAVMFASPIVGGMTFVKDEDDLASDSADHLATQQSIKAYVDAIVVSSVAHKGSYNAATDTPSLDTTPVGVLVGHMYTVSVAGTFYTEALEVGDVLIADINDPAALSDWTRVQKNLDAAGILTALLTVDSDTSGLNANFLQGALPNVSGVVNTVVKRGAVRGNIQVTGTSNSWGVQTQNTNLGGVNVVMGTGSSATWLASGTSGGVSRGGIQLLDNGAAMRLYASGGYCQISSAGTLSATLFSGSGASLTALNATNITAGVVAEARIHSSIARLAAPALTGDATAKTQALNNNSTRIATTAFVLGQRGTSTPLTAGIAASGTSYSFSPQDHRHGTDTSRHPAGHLFLDVSTGAFVHGTPGTTVVYVLSDAEFNVGSIDLEIDTNPTTGLANDVIFETPYTVPRTFIVDNENLGSNQYKIYFRVAPNGQPTNNDIEIPNGSRQFLYSNGNHIEGLSTATMGHITYDVAGGVFDNGGSPYTYIMPSIERNNSSFDLEITSDLVNGIKNDITIAIPDGHPGIFVIDNENLAASPYDIVIKNNNGTDPGVLVPNLSRFLVYSDGTHVESLTAVYTTGPSAGILLFNNRAPDANGNITPGNNDYTASNVGALSLGGGTLTGALAVNANVTVTGNIIVTGTVDGRDIAADGSKLDTIASNATVGATWGTDVGSVPLCLANATNGASNTAIFNSTHGYIQIGAQNTSWCHIYTDLPSFYFNKQLYVLGNKVYHAGSTDVDADTLGGVVENTTSAVSTIVKRDSAGDINVRLVRSEYDVTNPTIGFIMTQVDTASNNYVRPSTPAQVVTALGLDNVTNTSDANKPVSTAQQTALDLKANLASPTFTGTVSGITKAMVGLGSVDNTSDANKPVSTAQQTALDLKANLASPTFTGTVSGITKAMVGLDSVDNTSDANKPVSTAQQTALDLKANKASPTFTGTVSGVTKTHVGLGNVTNTSDANKPVSTAQQTALDLKANKASPTFTGTVSGITKTMVGLGSVDNTSDANKPVSSAQQTALNLKANLASPTFTGTVSGITKAMVGLGSVDNTSDANKPVSSAQQTALNLKANLASPAFSGTPSFASGASGGWSIEAGKHSFTTNDGLGNINLRLAHDTSQLCTEAGYAFHEEWAQATGEWQFNVSNVSLAISDPITWVKVFSLIPTGATVTGNIWVTGTVDGRDVATDGSKLDGVATGATAGATWGSNITSQPILVTQAAAELGTATAEKMWSAQRVKQAIVALAPNMTDGEIKTAYEANADTNAFTDAEQTKLGAATSAATANTLMMRDANARIIASRFKCTPSNGSGFRFWDDNDNNYSIQMSAWNDATYGGRLDATSDYNMYFSMTGGTNRGFVFRQGTTPVAQIDASGNFFLNGTADGRDLAVDGAKLDTLTTKYDSDTIAIPTTVDNTIEIGTYVYSSGGGVVRISASVNDSGISISKQYTVPLGWTEGGNVWRTLIPTHETGPFSNQDFDLEIHNNAGTSTLRIRRTSGNTAGNVEVTLEADGIPDSYTPSSTTSTSAVTLVYPGTVIRQMDNVAHSHGNLQVYGYIYSNAAVDNLDASHYMYQSASDGWLRRKTLANAQVELFKGHPKSSATPSSGAVYVLRDLAAYSYTGGNVVGTCKIDLGRTWQSSMSTYTIRGQNYNSSESWEVVVTAYDHIASADYLYTRAKITGTPPFSTIRLGHDGTNCCILLGITSTSFSFPNIVFAEARCGYINKSNMVDTTQAITVISSETGITIKDTPTIEWVLTSLNSGVLPAPAANTEKQINNWQYTSAIYSHSAWNAGPTHTLVGDNATGFVYVRVRAHHTGSYNYNVQARLKHNGTVVVTSPTVNAWPGPAADGAWSAWTSVAVVAGSYFVGETYGYFGSVTGTYEIRCSEQLLGFAPAIAA